MYWAACISMIDTSHAVRHIVCAGSQRSAGVWCLGVKTAADAPLVVLGIREDRVVVVRAWKSRCAVADQLCTGVYTRVAGELSDNGPEVASTTTGRSSYEHVSTAAR